MLKKKAKKSWRRHNNKGGCNCFLCEGNWLARLIFKSRTRSKFFKHPNKIFEE